jgi:hypothetical protein
MVTWITRWTIGKAIEDRYPRAEKRLRKAGRNSAARPCTIPVVGKLRPIADRRQPVVSRRFDILPTPEVYSLG